jgi:hypothetical protein
MILFLKNRVSVFNPTHNHVLTPEHFVHLIPNYCRLTEEDKQVINGLHSQGVRTCHIVGFLMGQEVVMKVSGLSERTYITIQIIKQGLENLHWFLLVIDFDAKELVYLDSFQSQRTLDKRKTQIKN